MITLQTSKPKNSIYMQTLKKNLPLFLTITLAIVAGSFLNEQINKARMSAPKAA